MDVLTHTRFAERKVAHRVFTRYYRARLVQPRAQAAALVLGPGLGVHLEDLAFDRLSQPPDDVNEVPSAIVRDERVRKEQLLIGAVLAPVLIEAAGRVSRLWEDGQLGL